MYFPVGNCVTIGPEISFYPMAAESNVRGDRLRNIHEVKNFFSRPERNLIENASYRVSVRVRYTLTISSRVMSSDGQSTIAIR